MHYHVLGAGSLGLLFAAHLAKTGHVTLLLRNQAAVDAFIASGSRVYLQELWRDPNASAKWTQSLTISAACVPCASTQSTPLEPIQRLVLATKAPAATAALRSVLPFLAPGARLLLLQNGGLAVADELRRQLGPQLELQPASSSNPTSTTQQAAGPAARIYLASVTHGCFRGEPPLDPPGPSDSAPHPSGARGVVHAGLGEVILGPLPPPPPHPAAATLDPDDSAFLSELAAALPGLALRPTPPLQLAAALASKLAANAAINPLTALLGCRNGALVEPGLGAPLPLPLPLPLLPVTGLDGAQGAGGGAGGGGGSGGGGRDGGLPGVMRAVCRELVAVLGPRAFALPPRALQAAVRGAPVQGSATGGGDGDRGGQGEAAAAEAREAEEALYEWVAGVARATSRNRSSMLQDVAAGRRTEVDYLTGWVVSQAAARGVDVPTNAALYALVKAKERLAEAEAEAEAEAKAGTGEGLAEPRGR